MRHYKETDLLFLCAMAVFSIAGWITHAVWIIRKLGGDVGATVGQMVLGALGIVMPPVGVLHGWLLWVGLA